MTTEEKKQRHREVARESARRKNGYYDREHLQKKEVHKPVVDLSNFDVWYEMNYIKGQNIQPPPPKVITFKEYNELMEKYNALIGVEK